MPLTKSARLHVTIRETCASRFSLTSSHSDSVACAIFSASRRLACTPAALWRRFQETVIDLVDSDPDFSQHPAPMNFQAAVSFLLQNDRILQLKQSHDLRLAFFEEVLGTALHPCFSYRLGLLSGSEPLGAIWARACIARLYLPKRSLMDLLQARELM